MTYHGVLAPASGLRSRVVPRRVVEEGDAVGCKHGAGGIEGENAAASLDAVARRSRTPGTLRSVGSRRSDGCASGCGFRMVAPGDTVVGDATRGRSCCGGRSASVGVVVEGVAP